MAHALTDSPIEALGSFKESLKIDPKDLRALTYLPGVLYDLGRVGEAVRYADQSMNLHAENVPALKSLADYRSRRRMVFGNEGRKTKGLIKDALRFAAQSPEAHESLSWFHLCRGEWTEGVAVLRRFAEQHRSNPEAWCDFARAQFRIGDTFGAADAIRGALTLDPDSHKVNSTACEVLSQLGPSPELRTLLEVILLKFPERWTTWTKVGLALITVFGEEEPACAIAEGGPRLQPQLPHAWFQQSQVLALAAKYQEAIMSAEIGWRWLPEDEDGLLSVPAACRLAENCLLINDRTRGEFWIAEASQRLAGLIGFDPANGYLWEGKLFELAGDRSGALASFTRAINHHLFYPARREADAAMARLTSPLSRSARRFPVG
jgi:tetratricopeptide (TPR) repeat protein